MPFLPGITSEKEQTCDFYQHHAHEDTPDPSLANDPQRDSPETTL